MRLNVALPVLALGALLALAALWLRPGPVKEPGPAAGPAPALAPPPASQPPPGPKPASGSIARAEPVASEQGTATPEPSHQAYVQARIAELQDLGADNTPASLDTILSELTNRDPEIRRAAREAAVQFGSRDAIPQLLAAAAQTDAPEEKLELQQAASFLELPTPAELAASRPAGAGSPPPPTARNPGVRAR